MSTIDNLKLWNEVCTTDPDMTKRVNQRGGFTAIDAQYQIKTATEIWGPYGSNWGVKNLNYGIIDCQEIYLDAVFFYPDGEFQMSVDAAYKVNNDLRKKLLTDFTTKALSKLGFNSDVFEGKFDNNKYLEKLKAEKAKENATPEIKALIDKVASCKSKDELELIWNNNKALQSNAAFKNAVVQSGIRFKAA